MKKEIRKFLEFNGTSIFFIASDGQFWVALKPICEALGISWKNQHEKLQNSDDIYNELSGDRGIVAADGKIRKMICLPEKFIYGWIFSIPLSGSMSDETKQNLSIYKKECCNVLYEHFHGSITGRKELLSEKAKTELKIDRCYNSIAPEIAFQMDQAKRKIKQLNSQLRELDLGVIAEEKTLFDSIVKS